MKKIYWIHNTIYYPLLTGNKWISGSISGFLFNDQYTIEEIQAKHLILNEANDLHDLIKQWGTPPNRLY